MNLQERIVQQRSRLQPTDTIITLPTGQVLKEHRGNIISTSVVGSTVGFVIDEKPDLQVASILPGLYMGSQDVVTTPGLLKTHNITHVLSLGVTLKLLDEDMSHLYVPLLDCPETDLSNALEQCLPFIDNARKEKGCVYVHCNAGISRAASVVIAYLIKEGSTFEDAYKTVKLKRPGAKPNEGFIQYLKELELRKR